MSNYEKAIKILEEKDRLQEDRFPYTTREQQAKSEAMVRYLQRELNKLPIADVNAAHESRFCSAHNI